MEMQKRLESAFPTGLEIPERFRFAEPLTQHEYGSSGFCVLLCGLGLCPEWHFHKLPIKDR